MSSRPKLEELYEKWVEICHNPNPTPKQKAAITRAWRRFTKAAELAGQNPYELSTELSQP